MLVSLNALELRCMHWIRRHAQPHTTLFLHICTRMGTPIGWILLCIGFAIYQMDIYWGIAIGMASCVGGISAEIIKQFIRRKRPCDEPNGILALGTIPNTHSFPSGHAASSASVASLLYCMHQPFLFFALFSVLVGFSRIYLGVHYPSDVIAGALLGLGCGWYCAQDLLPLIWG